MIDFSTAKAIKIPEGDVYKITCNGETLWESSYLNMVPSSKASDGTTIYNGGLGYKNGYRIRSGGAEGVLASSAHTGFIPVKGGDTIRISGGDFGRTERQRKVIMAMMDKIREMSIVELNDLLNELLPLITTDLTDAEILGYAVELLPILQYLSVESQQVPAKGAYKSASIDGKSVLVPDLKKNKKILQEIMATE